MRLAFIIIGLVGIVGAESPFSADEIRFFEERVRPVLAENCLDCHGERKAESGLRLDRRDLVLRGTDFQRVVDLKNPDREPAAGLGAASGGGRADAKRTRKSSGTGISRRWRNGSGSGCPGRRSRIPRRPTPGNPARSKPPPTGPSNRLRIRWRGSICRGGIPSTTWWHRPGRGPGSVPTPRLPRMFFCAACTTT